MKPTKPTHKKRMTNYDTKKETQTNDWNIYLEVWNVELFEWEIDFPEWETSEWECETDKSDTIKKDTQTNEN